MNSIRCWWEICVRFRMNSTCRMHFDFRLLLKLLSLMLKIPSIQIPYAWTGKEPVTSMLGWHTTATSRISWEPWMPESFGSPLLLLEREGEGLFLLLSLLLPFLPLLFLPRDSIMFEPKQQQLFTNKRDIFISTQHICSILHLVKNRRLEPKFCHEQLRKH